VYFASLGLSSGRKASKQGPCVHVNGSPRAEICDEGWEKGSSGEPWGPPWTSSAVLGGFTAC